MHPIGEERIIRVRGEILKGGELRFGAAQPPQSALMRQNH